MEDKPKKKSNKWIFALVIFLAVVATIIIASIMFSSGDDPTIVDNNTSDTKDNPTDTKDNPKDTKDKPKVEINDAHVNQMQAADEKVSQEILRMTAPEPIYISKVFEPEDVLEHLNRLKNAEQSTKEPECNNNVNIKNAMEAWSLKLLKSEVVKCSVLGNLVKRHANHINTLILYNYNDVIPAVGIQEYICMINYVKKNRHVINCGPEEWNTIANELMNLKTCD